MQIAFSFRLKRLVFTFSVPFRSRFRAVTTKTCSLEQHVAAFALWSNWSSTSITAKTSQALISESWGFRKHQLAFLLEKLENTFNAYCYSLDFATCWSALFNKTLANSVCSVDAQCVVNWHDEGCPSAWFLKLRSADMTVVVHFSSYENRRSLCLQFHKFDPESSAFVAKWLIISCSNVFVEFKIL